MKLKITYNLIQHFADKGEIKKLSIFLFLKSRFYSSVIKGSQCRKLASVIGISKSTAAKYMKVADEMGVFIKQGDDLLIISPKLLAYKLHIDNGAGFLLEKCNSVKEIEQKLLQSLIKRKSDQFNYIKQKSLHLKKTTKTYAQKKNAIKFMRDRKVAEGKYSVSYKRIAKNLGVSVGKAYRLILKMIKAGRVIKFTTFKIAYAGNKKYSGIGHFLSNKGNYIVVGRNEYVFN